MTVLLDGRGFAPSSLHHAIVQYAHDTHGFSYDPDAKQIMHEATLDQRRAVSALGHALQADLADLAQAAVDHLNDRHYDHVFYLSDVESQLIKEES